MKVLVTAVCAVALALQIWEPMDTIGSVSGMTPLAQRRITAINPQKRRPTSTPVRIDYSRFSHLTEQHRKACNSCHTFPSKNWKEVRTSDEAFPDVTEYPEHQACLGCHRQQFFARERPVPRICYNCHFNATPVETSRYTFPSLGEKFLSSAKATDFVSDFHVFFPHDKHLDVISKLFSPRQMQSVTFARASFRPNALINEDSEPKSCAVCHQTYQPQGKSDDEFVTKPPKNLDDAFWLKKGTFKTRPLTHAACFNCHNQESELAPLPQNCDACHKIPVTQKPPADFDEKLVKTIGVEDWWTRTASRDRISSGAFRHETHPDLSCTKCHGVAVMNPIDVKSLSVPVKSCGGAEGCHVTATSDEGGILNYEIDQRNKTANFVCTKCHIVFGSRPVPVSHLEAIPKAAK